MKIKSIKRKTEGTPGWLKKRFGENVAQISTITTLKLKSSIKDVFRGLHGYVPPHIEEFTKSLPAPPQGVSDKAFVFGYEDGDSHEMGLIETSVHLQEFALKYPKEWGLVTQTLGLGRSKSRHACGFVVADKPISEFIPIVTIGGYKVTQFAAPSVEAAGGLKMDFLIINALNDIQGAVKMIQKRNRPDIDWSKAYPAKGRILDVAPRIDSQTGSIPYVFAVPHTDGKIYDIYKLPRDTDVFNDICEGDTGSVFQLSQPGAKRWLSRFNFVKDRVGGKTIKGLSSMEDLATFTALDRPGALDAYVEGPEGRFNMLEEYARRALGRPPTGNLAILDELLPETYGVIATQEQLTYVFQKLGKTTGIQAQDFRNHVGKKQKMKVLEDRDIFMAGAVESVGQEVAEKLWEMMVTFAKYGFCLSGDQLIQTDEGLKAMKDLSELDKVATWVNGRIEYQFPKMVWKSGEKEVFEVTLEDGTTIAGTEDHTFLYEGEWVTLKDLMATPSIEVISNLEATCNERNEEG